jgi:hypothetical protein
MSKVSEYYQPWLYDFRIIPPEEPDESMDDMFDEMKDKLGQLADVCQSVMDKIAIIKELENNNES